MLKKQKWLRPENGLDIEVLQAEDEGKDISSLKTHIEDIISLPDNDPVKHSEAIEIFNKINSLPLVKDFKYIEPSGLDQIKEQKPENNFIIKQSGQISTDKLHDKIYGAWLGRCAGCLLGQPIEGWNIKRITDFLMNTGNYPIRNYLSSNISASLRKIYDVQDSPGPYGSKLKNWINNIDCMPEDDDINYTLLNLKLIEEYGYDFNSYDVGECWLMNLPILHTCTAERVAYKNIVNSIFPPDSGVFQNPYREWIGAQIRADFFGYLNPGNPELAAEFAWRDACISHSKNGIYGEMFIAAMLSASAVTDDIFAIISCGLSQIPLHSRMTEAIKKVIQWKKDGVSWKEAIKKIHLAYDENNMHHWAHVIPNAMIVCIGLIYGELDLEKTIGITVLGAMDTDCNAATSGSIIGMILGVNSLPGKWTKPLNDTLKSGVDGFGKVRISDMAKRTVNIIKKYDLDNSAK